jgi:hypothetical protein
LQKTMLSNPAPPLSMRNSNQTEPYIKAGDFRWWLSGCTSALEP